MHVDCETIFHHVWFVRFENSVFTRGVVKAIEKYVLLSTQQRARSRRRGRTNKLSNTRRRRKEEKEEEEEEEEEEGCEISFIKIREGKNFYAIGV